MNHNMRRLLDDDWDQVEEFHMRERDREREQEYRKPSKPGALERRQRAKEWGRSMNKFHRERKRNGLVSNKP